MKATQNFLAVDLGAASGRMVTARWDGGRFALEELHRFDNSGINLQEGVYWNVLRLWSEIRSGLEKYVARYGAAPASISVDTWGVDFALLDRAGRLVSNPHHYRDPRTNSTAAQVYARVSAEDVYGRTGIQHMPINTLFQLFSMVAAGDPRLEIADRLLMMPDLFHYWLCGDKANEYTIASTTQMIDCYKRDWALDILSRLAIPACLLGPISPPGTVLSDLLPDVARQCGLPHSFPVIAGASHDTAAAVAAIPGLDQNSVYISSGTWSLMGVELTDPVTTAEAQAFDVTNEGGVSGTVRLLKNIAGLWLLQECVRSWQKSRRQYAWNEVVEIAAASAPWSSLIDPDAEEFRAPEDMPAAIRAYCARTSQAVPVDDGALARCCLESLSLKCRVVLERLEKVTGRELRKILIVGGGSQNPLLCQLTADACRRPVVAGPAEASALGNAMIQAIATGHISSVASGRSSIAKSCEPVRFEPRSADGWDEAYERLCRLMRLPVGRQAQAG